MPHNAIATRPLELEISGKDNSPSNRINFHDTETVRDVLARIRRQLQLKPDVQIMINSLERPHQGLQRGDLIANEPMSKHFPRGGRVRIDTQAPVQGQRDLNIQENKAYDEARLNSIIALQSKDDSKASINKNSARNHSRMTNLITDDPKSVIDKLDFS